MRAIVALIAVFILIALSYLGVGVLGLYPVFGIIVPYFAVAVFLVGFIGKIIYWAKSPVPFNITTTSGQQKSLDFITPDRFENPSGMGGVLGRMFLEIFFFRSLFRNTRTGITKENRPGYESEKSLWLGGLVFHWSFFYVIMRHLRFFTYPVPGFVSSMESFDRLFQIGLPGLYLTDIFLLLAVTFLFFRRVVIPQIKYISLMADYFALFLIGAIAVTGVLMRYFERIDVAAIKTFIMSLVGFQPAVSNGIGILFYIHLFLVSSLLVYFPFSKLMHMGGIFMSPTRNMKGNSRQWRLVNPWNYPVKVHTYEEYEDDFREMMKGAGLPVEKEAATVPPDNNPGAGASQKE